MLRRDPALIVCLGSTRHSGSISAQHSYLISRIDLFRTTRGALSALTALSTTSFLWEQRCDPGVVDEVKGTEEDGKEEEVEEDTGRSR